MKQEEFLIISSTIKAAYPNAKIMPDHSSMNVWYLALGDIDYKICANVIQEHICTSKFAPSISELRERCSSYTTLPLKDYGEAWETVLKAIRRFGYMQEEDALNSLDDITRACTKRLGFQNICMSENITADRANFRMIYEEELKKRKTENQIPERVRLEKKNRLDQLIQGEINLLGGQ